MKTKSYAALASKQPLVPYEFDRRELRADDVAIKIHYCGVCHSDIHKARNEWKTSTFPMVTGHEITGEVVQVGSQVTRFKLGDKVGVGCFVNSCGACEQCKNHQEQYCPKVVGTYNSTDYDGTVTMGGYSDFIVVKESFVLRMPSNLPLDKSAPLLCAGITLYSPLMHWKVGKSTKIAIIGLGGLGHMGVKIANALGAEVTVLSQSLSKEPDAKRMGAKHFYATKDRSTFTTLKNSFDIIINTVSAEMDLNPYLGLLKVNGHFVSVGLPEEPYKNISPFYLITKRVSLGGSLVGGIKETQEMLDFCAKHNLLPEVEMINIQSINEAFDRVVKSDVKYRFVIDMKSLNQA